MAEVLGDDQEKRSNEGGGEEGRGEGSAEKGEPWKLSFSKPRLVRLAANTFSVPVAAAPDRQQRTPLNNFVKSIQFSPDGTCLLSASEDTVLNVFEVSEDRDASTSTSAQQDWKPCLRSVEGESIYDACWYPHMDSREPVSCVYLSSSRDHPLHLWDAFTGSLRASYRAYDHMDEIATATAVAFNCTGTKIYAGYDRMIRVFDTDQPGRAFESRPTCKTRRSRDGQKGLVSALAFSPDGSGLFAAGSYAGSIFLYDERSPRRAVAELQADMGGTTHLKFHPSGGHLFSGARRDGGILCWDVRQTAEAADRYCRPGNTNQRITFDVDPSGRHLATGSSEGRAAVFDLQAHFERSSNKSEQRHDGNGVGSAEASPQAGVWLRGFPDAVNGTAFHPHQPRLAFSTGQRHFSLEEQEQQRDDVLDADFGQVDVSAAFPHGMKQQNVIALFDLGVS